MTGRVRAVLAQAVLPRRRLADAAPGAGDLAWCETVTAGPDTPWHVRVLTVTGLHPNGAADSPALCGRTVAWDIRTTTVEEVAATTWPTCAGCREKVAQQQQQQQQQQQ